MYRLCRWCREEDSFDWYCHTLHACLTNASYIEVSQTLSLTLTLQHLTDQHPLPLYSLHLILYHPFLGRHHIISVMFALLDDHPDAIMMWKDTKYLPNECILKSKHYFSGKSPHTHAHRHSPTHTHADSRITDTNQDTLIDTLKRTHTHTFSCDVLYDTKHELVDGTVIRRSSCDVHTQIIFKTHVRTWMYTQLCSTSSLTFQFLSSMFFPHSPTFIAILSPPPSVALYLYLPSFPFPFRHESSALHTHTFIPKNRQQSYESAWPMPPHPRRNSSTRGAGGDDTAEGFTFLSLCERHLEVVNK